MVRDMVKWDDTPGSLQHFAESAVRAYKMAMTEPRGPVMLVVDATLQENPIVDRSRLHIPKLTLTTSAGRRSGRRWRKSAKLLVAAENPLIIAGRRRARRRRHAAAGGARRDAAGAGAGRRARHAQPASAERRRERPHRGRDPGAERGRPVSAASIAIAISRCESSTPLIKPDAKVISISSYDLYMKGNYQNVERFQEVTMAIAADPQATLPSLIEACKKLITPDRRRVMDERGKRSPPRRRKRSNARASECTYGWDASPITLQRLAVEVWDVIRDKDWASVGGGGGRLWNVDKFYRTMGSVNGGGVGGSLPIAIGAALAHRKHGPAVRAVPARRRHALRQQRAVDGDAPPHPDAVRDAQQPRVPPGGHAPAAHGESASARHGAGARAAFRARRSAIRTSTSRRWRAAWARMRKDRSRTRRTCGRRCCEPWSGSKRARSPCSTRSPSRDDGMTAGEAAMCMRLVACSSSRRPCSAAAAGAAQAAGRRAAGKRRERARSSSSSGPAGSATGSPRRAAASRDRDSPAASRRGRRSRVTCAGRRKR